MTTTSFYSEQAANRRNSFLLALLVVAVLAVFGFVIGYSIGYGSGASPIAYAIGLAPLPYPMEEPMTKPKIARTATTTRASRNELRRLAACSE